VPLILGREVFYHLIVQERKEGRKVEREDVVEVGISAGCPENDIQRSLLVRISQPDKLDQQLVGCQLSGGKAQMGLDGADDLLVASR